jgi:hypothetical protein
LNTNPTFGQQASQYTFLQDGHCQAAGLMKPPISFPHLPQKPRTISSTLQEILHTANKPLALRKWNKGEPEFCSVLEVIVWITLASAILGLEVSASLLSE